MLPVDEIQLNFNPASLALLNVVLGFLMFGIALDTRVDDFRRVLRMPWAISVGIAAQFIVLPAVTYVLTRLLGVGPSIALGMILVACCPPGNVSNLLTHRANGNVALSVSMTAVSNAIAIVAMPLNFAFWGGIEIRVPEDWEVQVKGTAILGGYGDETRTIEGDGRKVLVVTGTAIMGGVEIKN